MWLAALLPWLHSDDHPPEDLAQSQFRVSMPQSIEAFLQARLPQATRVELCFSEHRVVLRRVWERFAPGCLATDQNETIRLQTW
jgi:hypothetical protein